MIKRCSKRGRLWLTASIICSLLVGLLPVARLLIISWRVVGILISSNHNNIDIKCLVNLARGRVSSSDKIYTHPQCITPSSKETSRLPSTPTSSKKTMSSMATHQTHRLPSIWRQTWNYQHRYPSTLVVCLYPLAVAHPCPSSSWGVFYSSTHDTNYPITWHSSIIFTI